MYVLYGGDYTRASLVQWLLEEAGIQYEFRRINLLQGENRSAEYLSLNPAGLVPVLITPEGDILYEVAALMLYLTDRHGLGDLAPQVSEPERGSFLSAVLYIAGKIQSEMKRHHFPHRYAHEQKDDFALAHDTWISRFRYVDPKSGDWYCNEIDCGPIDRMRVERVEGGFLVDHEIFVESSRALPSNDDSYWTCFSSDIVSQGRGIKKGIRCFFAATGV